MKTAFYPGCVAKGGAPELYRSVRLVSEPLGITPVELMDAACTGAGVLTERNPLLADAINARTFAMAERSGLPIMTICSTCTGTMLECNLRLQDPAYRGRVNELLVPEGLEYRGTTEIRHLLWILVEEIGLERLGALVRRPLQGLRVAPFYGCYILRPSSRINADHPDRDHYLEDVIACLGATAVEYEGARKCCGFPITTMNRTNALRMTGKHVAEAKDQGADVMVTPCPLCHLELDGQQSEASGVLGRPLGLPVLHLPQLLGLALGFSPEQLGFRSHLVHVGDLVRS